MSSQQQHTERLGKELAAGIRNGDTVGLGSGSTVARVLPAMVRAMREKGVEATWVPTSLQIQAVAQELKVRVGPLTTPDIVKVVDGADQVDTKLNLIKGGGGALLKEKILLGSAKDSAIVADEKKFVEKLGMGDYRVPIEVSQFARETAMAMLKKRGSKDVKIRLDARGYPAYSENGNMLFDALFAPIEDPSRMEVELKSIPGVLEVGIFVIRPITVYRISPDGGYTALKSGA
ncbi:MAG TPA: ribose 5-phosphate isomerase A [Nitrososphaerales archaeon]|nr:ribose 5-phosphate isomerase A [Nitrososphaerales archaeon]